MTTSWTHYRQTARTVAHAYLWLVAFLVAIGLSVSVPMGLQPTAFLLEQGFDAPIDETWTTEALEQDLRAADDSFRVVPASASPREHEADYLVVWEALLGWRDDGPEPLGQMALDVLRDHNLQLRSLSMSSQRSLEDVMKGFDVTRPLTPAFWLPFVIVLLGFFYWQKRLKHSIREPIHERLKPGAIALAVLISVPLVPLIGVLVGWLNPEAVDRIPQFKLTWQEWPLILTVVVLIPLAEEILFRGWLLERLGQALHPVLALFISAAVFSAIHPMGLVANLIFLIPGLFWGYLWLRYRSLLVCTIAHGAYNAMALLMTSLLST